MLKSVDILIGLVVVLLALSMAVTVVTQSLTTLLNSRGRHLKRGLEDLLQQLDPDLTAAISQKVADKVLTHPLVSGSSMPTSWLGALFGTRYGNVIHREEFTKLLIALAGGGGSEKLDTATRQVLQDALARNGVTDPAKTLEAVRGFAMELEKTAPSLANTARQNLAFLHAAPSDLVAKINSWFDQTMDRTAQRFTASTRAITFAGAFLVAFGLQVDTPSLANRLAMDDKMRDAFVAMAKETNEARAADEANEQAAKAAAAPTAATEPTAAPAPPPAPPAPAGPPGSPTPTKLEADYRTFLAENGIVHLPSGENYWQGFGKPSAVLGMLVTALLLSLGAPFWYNMLSRLLQLRSVLAFKDDKQRSERQDTTATAPSAGGAAPGDTPSTTPDILAGERGNLAAVG